jgi:hypothetical protein
MILKLYKMADFKSTTLEISDTISWKTIKTIIDPNSEVFSNAKKQALEKSNFTMDASQSGEIRTKDTKYQSQLRGCIAEAYAKLLIEQYSELKGLKVEVVRYDDVRTDGFKSPKGEYDIKVIVSYTERFLEARSSISHDRDFIQGIIDFDIIGPYSSIAKKEEKPNDFYIRPLYEYIDFEKKDFYKHDFEDLIRDEKVFLHFVGGTTFRQLKEEGEDKNMGQGKTVYRVIKILKGLNIAQFLKKITE